MSFCLIPSPESRECTFFFHLVVVFLGMIDINEWRVKVLCACACTCVCVYLYCFYCDESLRRSILGE
jgi:hypothetical protein